MYTTFRSKGFAFLAFTYCLTGFNVLAVESFVEEFTGAFDNPDWVTAGDFTFEPEGVRFVNESDEFEVSFSDQFDRRLNGSGSFVATLEFSELDMGEYARGDSTGFALVDVVFDLSPGVDSVDRFGFTLANFPGLDGFWNLSVGYTGSSGLGGIVSPATGPVMLEVGADAMTNELWFRYDNDTSDEVVAVEFGPFAHSPTRAADVDMSIIVAASGKGHQSGVLDSVAVSGASLPGDFNRDGELDVGDADLLIYAVGSDDRRFDLTDDARVDNDDLAFWVHDLRQTFFGDANLDGEFASSDLVFVFGEGQYEDEIAGNSTWATGDWNADGEFSTSDLVLAFQDGGYEQGPRAAVVPEPSAVLLGIIAVVGLLYRRRWF